MFEEAEKCEDRTIAHYRAALARDTSPETRRVIERQYESARLAHQAIRGIRDRLRTTA
jgi:uncharacterized protein (TIGR02284 family)